MLRPQGGFSRPHQDTQGTCRHHRQADVGRGRIWQQQEQLAGIITTPSCKFKAAALEPPDIPVVGIPPPHVGAVHQAHTPSPLLHDWRTIAYTDGSKIDVLENGSKLYVPAYEQEGKQSELTIDPAGAGSTNTINKAELAGICAAARAAAHHSH